MRKHVATALTGEVEVTMLRQVDVRRPVGGGLIFDHELVRLGQLVADGRRQRAGVTLFTVGADVADNDHAVPATRTRRRSTSPC